MLLSIVVSLALVGLAVAPPPVSTTICYEDNLLRAFQHTPIPADSYCITGTGQPTFITPTTYPATRLSSACSCFSRIPSETLSSSPCASTTHYGFRATGSAGGDEAGFLVDLVVTVTPSTTCSSGFLITNACGVFNNHAVTFDATDSGDFADYCFFPGPNNNLDVGGFNFQAGGLHYNLYFTNRYLIESFVGNVATGTTTFPGTFKAVCGALALC